MQELQNAGIEFTWDIADEIMDSVISSRILNELENRKATDSDRKAESANVNTDLHKDMKSKDSPQSMSKKNKAKRLTNNLKNTNIAKKLQRSANAVGQVAKCVKPKHIIKGLAVITVTTVGVIVVAKNPELIKKPMNMIEKQLGKIGSKKTTNSTIKRAEGLVKNVTSNPVGLATKIGASQLEDELLSAIPVGIASRFGMGMDKVSVFRPVYDLYKSGVITMEQLIEEILEIQKLTRKNPLKWLKMLSGKFKDSKAIEVLNELAR